MNWIIQQGASAADSIKQNQQAQRHFILDYQIRGTKGSNNGPEGRKHAGLIGQHQADGVGVVEAPEEAGENAEWSRFKEVEAEKSPVLRKETDTQICYPKDPK